MNLLNRIKGTSHSLGTVGKAAKTLVISAAAVAMLTTAVNAETIVRGFKGGQCAEAHVTLKTGMNQTFRFGGRSANVSVPMRYKGNAEGAKVAFAGMAGVVTALQRAGGLDSAQFYMKCPRYFEGKPNPWAEFCGTGRVTRAGKSISNAFSRSCHRVRSVEGIYRFFQRSSSLDTGTTTRHTTAARRADAGVTRRTGGNVTRQRACKGADGCFSWTMTVK